VLLQSSTYKCDVWSLGCCLFGLVCLTPIWFKSSGDTLEAYTYPFAPPMDESRAELESYLRRQKAGPDVYNTQEESLPTLGYRDLIGRMLTYKEQDRPHMKQVLAHDWFKGTQQQSQILEPDQLDWMVSFLRSSALEEAILLDVASQLPLCELSDFRGLFRHADVDQNGQLDSQELAEVMVAAGMDPVLAQKVGKRFARAGPVEFSRFVAALVPSRRELLLPYLRDAFNRLDIDGDGSITATELQQLLESANLDTSRASTTVDSMMKALGGCEEITFELLNKHFSDLCIASTPRTS